MKIEYRRGKTIYTATKTNDDFQLDVEDIEYPYGRRKIVKIIPKAPIILEKAFIEKDLYWNKDTEFFLNGYQSWTDTKGFYFHDRMRGLEHLPKKIIDKYQFHKYGDYSFTEYAKGLLHGITYSYMREKDKYKLIGSLNERTAYLTIYYDFNKKAIRLASDVENREISQEFIVFDYLEVEGSHKEVFDTYLDKLPACRELPRLLGYTSWYNYYQDINEDIILRDLEGLGEEYNLFQIDDGYQTHIGDWFSIDKNKFPEGLDPIINKIKEEKMIPGIWLAPFVCEKDSLIFKEKNHWIAKDEKGEPIMAGSNWSGFYALDWKNPEVEEYIQKVFEKYHDHYGFEFFKLDFLYAASLPLGYGMTRAEKMDEAMKLIRKFLPQAYILGCGLPLSSGFGRVDYCRIGPDVSLKFDDLWYMKWMHRERISTKNTILNTIYRRELDKRVFYNDPDVYLLRDENIQLSYEQKKALLYINFLFGSVLLTSDNIKGLRNEMKELYQGAKKLLRATNKRVVRNKKWISIYYQLDGKDYHLKYNIEKGVLKDG